jgi:TolA-binding protein
MIMLEDIPTRKRIFLLIAVAAALQLAQVAAIAGGSAPEKLSQLEQSIVGETSAGAPIEQRLKQLEKKVFAKAQTGSLTSRISALEKFAGISSSDHMPPLPPQFDNGKLPKRQARSSGSGGAGKEPLTGELERAVKLHHEGKDYEAEKSLKEIIGRDSKNADAYFSLGAIAETNGDLHSALDYYSSAMQANPNDPEAQDAVAELSRKIAAADSAPFVNPLAPPVAPAPNVLQGRALSVNAASGANSGNFSTQTAINAPPMATLPVTQPNRNPSFARSFARAALGVALSGTGLHCPVCQLMKGF